MLYTYLLDWHAQEKLKGREEYSLPLVTLDIVLVSRERNYSSIDESPLYGGIPFPNSRHIVISP